MTTPINLRRARKAKAREEARRKADANAARHGRGKAEKAIEAAEAARAARAHDGLKLVEPNEIPEDKDDQ